MILHDGIICKYRKAVMRCIIYTFRNAVFHKYVTTRYYLSNDKYTDSVRNPKLLSSMIVFEISFNKILKGSLST